MRKILLLFTFIIIAVVGTQAQQQKPSFGLRAGANYSGISGDEVDLDRMFGFHAGVVSNFYVTYDSFFVVQPEILYSLKGAENEDEDLKIRLGYIDVPVLAKINAGFLYFEGGPQASFRIHTDIEGDQDDLVDDDDDHFFRRVSVGYVAGVGITSTPLGFGVGVRYNGDISALNNTDNIPNIRNNWFSLTLTFLLPSRKYY